MEDQNLPDYYQEFAPITDTSPLLIAVKYGEYSPRRFRKAIKKFTRHFDIPFNLPSLIAIASFHDYELVATRRYAMLIKVNSVFDRMIEDSPLFIETAIEAESDRSIVKVL